MFCITWFCHSWEKLPHLPSLWNFGKHIVRPHLAPSYGPSCTQLLSSYCLKFSMMSLPETPSGAKISAKPGWSDVKKHGTFEVDGIPWRNPISINRICFAFYQNLPINESHPFAGKGFRMLDVSENVVQCIILCSSKLKYGPYNCRLIKSETDSFGYTLNILG